VAVGRTAGQLPINKGKFLASDRPASRALLLGFVTCPSLSEHSAALKKNRDANRPRAFRAFGWSWTVLDIGGCKLEWAPTNPKFASFIGHTICGAIFSRPANCLRRDHSTARTLEGPGTEAARLAAWLGSRLKAQPDGNPGLPTYHETSLKGRDSPSRQWFLLAIEILPSRCLVAFATVRSSPRG
jgi:hypothetical protein